MVPNSILVLVVDDEPDILGLLKLSLKRLGLDVETATCVKEAKQKIRTHQFDLALTDMRLPDGDGLEIINHFKSKQEHAPIAVMTAFDTTEVAIEAMKAGAFDFLPKPLRQQRLQLLVRDALGDKIKQHQEAGSPRAKQAISDQDNEYQSPLLGTTEAMVALRKTITKVARTQAPIMIYGESGTGKELAAKSIHMQSPRKEKPFVAVNCGAIPGELMESEFFGHLKGSFTGASANKTGLFQAAEGGTLFLDEVAELPLNMQVKLLRAIQERAVRPVGAQQEQPVNVRLVSATHKPLMTLIDQGEFRQDLYYRINVIDLTIPPLRERKADIRPIAELIMRNLGVPTPVLGSQVEEKLQSYAYPGNVRELENILHRAMTLCGKGDDLLDHIALPQNTPSAPGSTKTNTHSDIAEIDDLERYLADIEKDIIESALEIERWNRRKTAERLGLTMRQFRYKLVKLGITDDD